MLRMWDHHVWTTTEKKIDTLSERKRCDQTNTAFSYKSNVQIQLQYMFFCQVTQAYSEKENQSPPNRKKVLKS